MKNKRFKLALITMVSVCLLILCSCGNDESGKEESNNAGTQNESADNDDVQGQESEWYLGEISPDDDMETLFAGVEDTVNPEEIYKSLNLTEKMISGVYTVNNKEKDVDKIRAEIPFEEIAFGDVSFNLSTLPVAVYMGKENICSSQTDYSFSEYKNVSDKEVAVIELAGEEQLVHVMCTYEIKDNVITFKEILKTISEGNEFSYEFSGIEFSYDIEVSGPYMTFSNDGNSVTLKAFCFTENTEKSLTMNGYSLPDSPLIGELDYFSTADAWTYAVKRNGDYYDYSAYKIDDEGRFTVYLEKNDPATGETEKVMNQYTYLVQSSASSFMTDFGVVLFDGNKEYYYTDNVTKREIRALEEQDVNVNSLEESVIKEIADKKTDLYNDLYNEFEANGINAVINRSMGEIAIDATVLFEVSDSTVSDDGKALLQNFMNVFSSVAFNDKYKDFVSGIIVEGHTDTDGDYELNQQLSKDRADSVKKYCLSEECVMDSAYKNNLKDMFETVGYAYDKPIYDENGEVDKEASRRVSFRICVNVE